MAYVFALLPVVVVLPASGEGRAGPRLLLLAMGAGPATIAVRRLLDRGVLSARRFRALMARYFVARMFLLRNGRWPGHRRYAVIVDDGGAASQCRRRQCVLSHARRQRSVWPGCGARRGRPMVDAGVPESQIHAEWFGFH